jgi:hypothetical protein
VLALVLASAACGTPAGVQAHEIAGNRFFPATLAIDDPGVNDELAMPTITMTKSGDEPPVKELDISGEYAKRLTDSLAISVAPAWTPQRQRRQRLSEPGDDAEVPVLPGPGARTRHVRRALARLGRQRRIGRRC